MRIWMFLLFLLVCDWTPTAFAQGRSSSGGGARESFQFTLSSGPGLSFPGSIRFRVHQVEFGTYPPALGVTKYFPINNFYAQLGAGLGVLGQTDLGLLGAVGWDPKLFAIFGFRLEAYSYVGTKGLLYTGAGVGLSVRF